MRRQFECLLGFLLLCFPLAGVSQSNSAVLPWDQPLVATPILTLGNGLTTGPVITYSGSVSTTSPLDMSTVPSAVWMPSEELPAPRATEYRTELSIASLDSAYGLSSSAISLGALAQSLKVNHPELAHKNFGNTDIAQILSRDAGQTGIIEARTASGPIAPKKNFEDAFEPETGIANMPYHDRASDPAFADGSSRSGRSDDRDAPAANAQKDDGATKPSLDGPGRQKRGNPFLPAGEPNQD